MTQKSLRPDSTGVQGQMLARPAEHCWVFAEFRLDLPNARLWRAQEIVHLYPKTFAVLDCLVARAGQLVTKDTLLEAVWPEAVVSEAVHGLS